MRARGFVTLAVIGAAGGLGYWYVQRSPPPPSTRPIASGARVPADALEAAPAPTSAVAVEAGTHTVQLLARAAVAYRTEAVAEPDDLMRALSPLADQLGRPAVWDEALSRAARELAAQSRTWRGIPPAPVIAMVLQASGAPDRSASVSVVTAQEDPALAMREALASVAGKLSGPGELRVGIGEVVDDQDAHAIAVVVLRRDFTFDAPTWTSLGERWQGRLRPLTDWREPRAHALSPAGELREVPVDTTGPTWTLGFVPDARGVWSIGIDGEGPEGPGKLMQVTVWVGEPPPQALEVSLRTPDPTGLTDGGAAQRALQALNADRTALGLPALIDDPALAAVARTHSLDMRDHRYFAHRSPRTGLLADRLADAGVVTVMAGENLAKNNDLGEAQAALLASVGHRANIVSTEFTHVGVGVVRDADGQWLVTQVFARPPETLSVRSLDDLAERINQLRTTRGLPGLRRDVSVEGDLQRAMSVHQFADFAGLAARMVEALRARGGSGQVSTHRVSLLTQIEPTGIDDRDARGLALAMVQNAATGQIDVVVVTLR